MRVGGLERSGLRQRSRHTRYWYAHPSTTNRAQDPDGAWEPVRSCRSLPRSAPDHAWRRADMRASNSRWRLWRDSDHDGDRKSDRRPLQAQADDYRSSVHPQARVRRRGVRAAPAGAEPMKRRPAVQCGCLVPSTRGPRPFLCPAHGGRQETHRRACARWEGRAPSLPPRAEPADPPDPEADALARQRAEDTSLPEYAR